MNGPQWARRVDLGTQGTLHARLLLIALARYSDDDPPGWPAAATLVTTTGMRPQRITDALQLLDHLDLVRGLDRHCPTCQARLVPVLVRQGAEQPTCPTCGPVQP